MAKFRKHLNHHYKKEKLVKKLRRDSDDTWFLIRNQGYIELDTPIEDGYNANWVLRKDISNREDAWAYQEALDLCNTTVWCKKKDFLIKEWKTKKYVKLNPGLRKITKHEYDNLSPTAKKFFYESSLENSKYWRQGFTDKHYYCTLSYELVIEITQSYITHRREHNSVLYSHRSEVEARLNKLTDGHIYGGYGGEGKFWRKHENKKLKTVAINRMRSEINETH